MTMNDKELLELAAKAAGVKGVWHEWWDDQTDSTSCGIAPKGACGRDWWNPLRRDGEALRLAVSLHLIIMVNPTCTETAAPGLVRTRENFADSGGDKYAATRRAITRAAAEIGRTN